MKTLIPVRATKAIDQQIMGMEGQYGGTQYIPLANLQTWTGLGVSPETALNIITVYQCVRLLSKTFASMPLHLYRRLDGGGKDRAQDHPLYRTFHLQPNPDMTSFVWRELMMGHLLTWGNSYNERVINGFGELELWPLRPDRMEVKWGTNGRKSYTYVYPSGERQSLPTEKVFHVPGMSSNGLVGFSPISLLRTTISLMRSAENYGESVFSNGARPAGVLSHPKTLSTPAIERLATQMDALRGSGNAGKTVVLEEGLTFDAIGFPPEDAQFMQTRLFQKRELVAAYGIQPHKVGDLERATFSNIAEQNIEFISDTMMEHFVRFEQESQVQLTPDEPDIFAEFLVDGYLRGNPVDRANAFAARWQHGNLSGDEWRAAENENPLPDGLGKQYYVPVNYVAVNPPADQNAQDQAIADVVPDGTQPPQLVAVKSAAFRCPECNAKLAEFATPGTQIRCGRCKEVREVAETKSAPPILTIVEPPQEFRYDADGLLIATS